MHFHKYFLLRSVDGTLRLKNLAHPVCNALFYYCFYPGNPDISCHIWASSFYFAARENPCDRWNWTAAKNKALNVTGEDVSEGHFGTESRLLNAYGSPRDQNENRAAARREEDVSESRSVVNRVERNFNFSFILKCMLLLLVSFHFNF